MPETRDRRSAGTEPERPDRVAQAIRMRMADPSPRGIASAIGALIGDGELHTGDRLPTVRSLARHLDVSVNVVADAWRLLQNHGAIVTDRRRGTTVRAARSSFEGRYWQVPVEPGTLAIDLSTGTPDPAMLPDLGPVLREVGASVAVTSYLDAATLPGLDDELRRRWPFAPERLTVVDGALDALDRIISAVVRVGDTVVVEDPTFPPILDMLDLAGATAIGVPVDERGVDLAATERAMSTDPSLIILQPRGQNPTGALLDTERAGAIARLVAGTRTLVLEDDHSGPVGGATLASVGEHVPEQVIHVRSFSKSHGPDLRIAAIGGHRATVDAVERRRRLGPSWTSRLTQQILLTLLTDDAIEAQIADAAHAYARRRGRLERALTELGVEVQRGSGINLWIRVADEQRAGIALAARGIGVGPGRPFCVAETDDDHIRVSVGELADADIETVASAIAAAASTPGTLGIS